MNSSNFSTFLMRKNSRKANQKPRKERTGTRLGCDIDSVSQKSRVKANRVTRNITAFVAITFCLNDGK